MERYTRQLLAVTARCDERSVVKYLDGIALRESVAVRIREAMEELKIADPTKTPVSVGQTETPPAPETAAPKLKTASKR
jgi:hypothetical protein